MAEMSKFVRFVAAVGAVTLLLPAVAKAADAQVFPCMEEIEKYCKDVPLGEGRILLCLSGHDKELSAVCRSKVDENLRKVEEAKKLCEADIKRFCADVKPGEGRLLRCLQSKREGLTSECRKQVVKLGGKTPAESVTAKPEDPVRPSGKGGR
jgi:hypothetical protein